MADIKNKKPFKDEVYNKVFEDLWRLLVPIEGSCTSLEGELIRAIGRLEEEYLSNGNGNAYYDGKLQDMYAYFLRLIQFNVPKSKGLVQAIEQTIVEKNINCNFSPEEKKPYELLKKLVTHYVSNKIYSTVMFFPEDVSEYLNQKE